MEVTPTISKLEDDTYYIFGATRDQAFDIEKNNNFSYEVVDEENIKYDMEEITKDNIITIKPKNYFEEGKNYTIKIKNGTFINEELKEASVVVFSVQRKSKQKVEIKDNIIKVNNADITFNDNNTIKLNNVKLKKDDIILIDDAEAYKIGNCNNSICDITIPTLDDVYSEFDYYGIDEVNMENFIFNPDFQEYIAYNVKKSFIDKLIPSVKADSKLKAEMQYDNKTNEVVIKLELYTTPGDKLFGSKFLDNHKFSNTYEIRVKLKVYKDIGYVNSDVAIIPTITLKIGVDVEHKAFKKGLDKLKETITKDKLVDITRILTEAEKDTINNNKNIGHLSVPSGIPGLNIIFNGGYLFEVDLKSNLNLNLESKITATVGYSTKKGLYGSINHNESANASFTGEGEIRVGFQGETGVSILNIMDVVGKLKVGGYENGKMSIVSQLIQNSKTIITITGEMGMFANVSVEAKVLGKSLTPYTIFNGKQPLASTDATLDAQDIFISGDKPVSSTTNDKTTTNDNKKPNNDKDSSGNGFQAPTSSQPQEYTISVYYTGCSCGNEGQTCHDYDVKVKAGDKLGNYKDKWSHPLGQNGETTLETFNKYWKKYNELSNKSESAYNSCLIENNYDEFKNQENFSELRRIEDACMEKYREVWNGFNMEEFPRELTKETIINKNYNLIYQCGYGSIE